MAYTFMIQSIKKILIYVLFALTVISYTTVRAVDDFNYLLNSRPLKYRLVRYLEERFKTTVKVSGLHINILPAPGIGFTQVAIGPLEGFHAAADEVALVFSPIRRLMGGDWLKRIRLDHFRLVISVDPKSGRISLPSFTLPEIEIDHPDITIHSGKNIITLEGPLNGRVRVTSNGTFSVVGQIDCNGTDIRYNDDVLTLRGMVMMKGRDLASSGLVFASGNLTIFASGTYTWAERRTFHGRVHIRGLAVGGGTGGRSPVLDAILDRLNGSADFSIADMTLFGIPLDTVVTSAVVKDGTMMLTDLLATGAFLSGSGSVTVAPNQPTAFDVVFTLRNYDITKMLGTVATGIPWIYGVMNLDGRVWGTSGSINGDLNFSSFKGRLMKFEVMSKIFSALNFYKMILQKHPDIMSRGFPYHSILSRFTIKDSVISFKHFYLDSDSMQIMASGNYSLRTNSINALMGFRPLELVDQVVGMIPVIGWILEGPDKGVIVIYLKLTGDINKLQVRPAPVATAALEVGGILIRTFMLPYTLFTKPKNLIPALIDNKPQVKGAPKTK